VAMTLLVTQQEFDVSNYMHSSIFRCQFRKEEGKLAQTTNFHLRRLDFVTNHR